MEKVEYWRIYQFYGESSRLIGLSILRKTNQIEKSEERLDFAFFGKPTRIEIIWISWFNRKRHFPMKQEKVRKNWCKQEI